MDWRRWRDHWLGDPGFRRHIARWPFGRAVAAHHARRLFETVAGFVPAQMLAAAVELGVFETLRAGPRLWHEVTNLPPPGAEALRQGLLAAGLVEPRGDRIGLTIDGLVVASDAGLRAMIDHNRLLIADLADPVATLRGTGPGRIAAFWPYLGGGGDPAGYSALMAASNAMVADALLDHPALRRAHHVMDVGGGTGAFLRALRRRRPHLALSLVDLPAVVARLDLASDRIAVHAAGPDTALPPGADTVTLLRVLHDLDDAPAAALLARIARALPPGGRIVVAEPMAQGGRDAQTGYFAAYFAAMGSGRLRSADAVSTLLAAAGFARIRRHRPSPLVTIVTARSVSTSIDVA